MDYEKVEVHDPNYYKNKKSKEKELITRKKNRLKRKRLKRSKK